MTSSASHDIFLDCQQAASHLGVSVKTIRRWAQSGKLKGKKVGSRGDWRFMRNNLDVLAKENKQYSVNPAPQNDEVFAKAFQASPVPMKIINLTTGKWIDANKQYLNLVGYSRSEVIGRNSIDLGITIEDHSISKRANRLKILQQKAKQTDFEITIQTKKGDKKCLRGSSVQVMIGGEKHAVSQYIDITEQRAAEQLLIERESRYRSLFDSIDGGFCIIEMLYDDSGKAYDYLFLEVNAVFEDISKMKKPVGKTIRQMVPKIPQSWIDTYAAVAETGVANRSTDYSESRKRWYEVYATRVGGDDSRIVALFFDDVTQKRQDQVKQEKYDKLSLERNELIEIGKAKDEFIGMASHQLRTPATAVKQYIGILLAGLGGDLTEQQQRYLEVAYNSNERQLKLINDLLKTAQIDSDTYKLRRSTQDIVGLLRASLLALKPLFEQQNQKLVVIGLNASINANVDAVEMDLVFSNLLENASKYSHEKSKITITLSNDDRAVYIAIADEGVGIHENDRDKIFEKFTRITNELSDTSMGTGLGLYWVQHIVKLHGGTITVSSNPHKGSTFTITLPL
jgi:PAS domain S-box-containing protein/excisionase family DNA binding protein